MSAREVIALALRGHQKWVDDDMPADETDCCADAVLDALSRDGYAVVDAERFRIARKGFVDLTEAWAELRMDTEKDQALHDRLVATSRVSAALLPEVTP